LSDADQAFVKAQTAKPAGAASPGQAHAPTVSPIDRLADALAAEWTLKAVRDIHGVGAADLKDDDHVARVMIRQCTSPSRLLAQYAVVVFSQDVNHAKLIALQALGSASDEAFRELFTIDTSILEGIADGATANSGPSMQLAHSEMQLACSEIIARAPPESDSKGGGGLVVDVRDPKTAAAIIGRELPWKANRHRNSSPIRQ